MVVGDGEGDGYTLLLGNLVKKGGGEEREEGW